MTYLRDLADKIKNNLDSDLVPEGDTVLLFDLYALIGMLRGRETTSADVHDAWVLWMMSRGKTHEAMVPYDQLPQETRAKDEPFAEAIRAATVNAQT